MNYYLIIIASLTIIFLIISLYQINHQETFTNNTFNPPSEIKLYYASWCGPSRAFLPTWDEFTKQANSTFPNLKVTKILCEGDTANMCNQAGIEGFPTAILYKTDQEIPYSGDRTLNDLMNFIKKNI